MTDYAELAIKVDTTQLTKAKVEKLNMVAASKKLEATESSLAVTNRKLETTNKLLAASTDKVERETLQATSAQLAAKSAALQVDAANQKLALSNGRVAVSSGNATYKVGQLGLQAQDVAVQLESGTQASRVFVQQFGQIASVFGPAGAVVGAIGVTVGAIAGPLISTLFNSGEAAEELVEKIKGLSDEYKNLTAAQAEFLSRQIAPELEEEIQKRDEATKKVQDYTKWLQVAQKNLDELNAGLQRQGNSDQAELVAARQKKLTDNIEDLNKRLNEQQTIADTATNAIEKYNEVIADPTGSMKKREEGVKAIISALGDELAAITMSESALLNRQLTQSNATNEEIAAAEAIRKTIEAEKDKIRVQQQNATLEESLSRIEYQQADPATRAAIAFERRNQVIQDANERLNLSEQRYNQLRTDNALKLQADLVAAEKRTQDQKSQILTDGQQAALSASGQLFGNLAAIAKEGGEKQFQEYKNLASAQAAISAALAITNVLSTPGIPYPLAVGLAASMGALTAVQIAKIQGQEYSARVGGGQVQAGGQYLVGENGPELLQMGRQGGNITPNHAMGSEGKSQTVQQIFNISPGLSGLVQAEIQRAIPLMAKVAVSSVSGDIRRGGSTAKAVGIR
jgi:chromosome segregation ATPase